MKRILVATSLSLLLAPAVRAVDGLIELSHACALHTGCLPGDAPGYPVTIGLAGGYRLTSNLLVPDEDTDGIQITASDVDVDLNHFAIVRADCEGATASCTLAGSGRGIDGGDIGIHGTSVRNGSVVGMGDHGLLLSSQADVQGVRVRWNGDSGISVDDGSRIVGCLIHENGGAGIVANDGGLITGNVVYQNDEGIDADDGMLVSGNAVYANDGAGVETGNGSLVLGNAATFNTGLGVDADPGSGIRENVLDSNGAGTLGASGVDLGANACDDAATCP